MTSRELDAAWMQLLAYAGAGLALFDAQDRLVVANAQAAALAGAPAWTAGQDLAQLLPGLLEGPTGDPRPAEVLTYPAADGRWLEVRLTPVPEGGFALNVQDVSAQVAQGRQAAQKEAALAQAMQHAPVGVLVFDQAHRLVEVNERSEIWALPVAVQLAAGDTLEVVLTTMVARLFGAEGAPEGAEAIRVGLAMDRSQRQYRRISAPGRAVEVYSDPTLDVGFMLTVCDVTELTAAEAAAREMATRMSDLLDALPHRVMMWGADRRLLLTNDTMKECFVPAAGRIGDLYDDMIVDQILAEHGPGPTAEAVIAGLRAQDRSVKFEAEWTHQNGRAFLTRSIPMRDGAFLITSTEITELVQAREAMRRNATMLEGLLEALPHRVSMWDGAHRLLTTNHALEDVFPNDRGGLRYDDLARWQIAQVFGDGAEAEALIAQECEADRSLPREFEWTLPNGRSFLARSTPLRDGGFVVSNTDITETVRQRRAAEENAALLDRVLQALPHRLAVWGADQRLLASNFAFPDCFGVIEGDGPVYYDDLLVAQARGMHGESAEAEAMIARHRSLDRTQPDEFEWRHQNGRYFLGRSTPTPDGGFIVTNTEITDLVQAREAARQNAAMLNSLVQALPNRVSLWGADKRLLAHNGRFAEAFPLPDGDGPIYHDQLIALQAKVAGANEAEVQALMDYYQQADRSQRSEREWTHANGMSFLSISVPAGNGGFIVSNTDITARVAAEREVQRRGDMLDALLKALPHRITLWSRTHELLASNEREAEWFDAYAPTGKIHYAERMRAQVEGIMGPGPAAEIEISRRLEINRAQPGSFEWKHANGKTYLYSTNPMPDGGFVVSNTDITELAQARQAAERAAETLRNLLAALPQRVSLWDENRRLVASNDAFHDELGALRPHDRQAVLFDDDMRAMAKRFYGDGAEAAKMAADVLSTDRSKPATREWRLPSGRVVTSLSVPMPDGGFVISTSDITDLVQAREAAQRTTETLSALLKALPHRVSMWDREGRLVAFNTAFAAFFRNIVRTVGMPGHEAWQMMQELMDPSDPSAALHVNDLGGFVGVFVWRHRDGAYFATQVVPSDDGGYVLTHTNVTEQETTRRRLVAAEAEQRALISAIPGAVLRLGKDAAGMFVIHFASPQIERLTGYTPEEVLQPGWLGLFTTPADRANTNAMAQRAWEGEDVSMEIEVTRRDGHHVWLQGHLRRDLKPDGALELIAIWFDVTTLRRATQEVAATRKLAALGALATGMAHELNQPLAGIMLAAENGLRNLTRSPERVEQKLETIIQQARRASDLINQMRVFRRRDADAPPQVALEDVVRPALKKCQGWLNQAKVRPQVAIEPGLPALQADKVLLEAALVNVITNACEAYGRVAAEGERVLEITGQLVGDEVQIMVRDEAGGIAPDILPYVFDPFFTTKPVGGGPGLGLAVAFGIVADLRGSIRAEGNAGATAIVISLPVEG